ncbi:SpoIIE family protein phosphatase [Methanimicrococcus sp. OttesenSCG-928-J09]|nr:SpoIIE family protein phosphatase [Methanimicrococcus sp. OttesenSCG-928-J09]
MSSKKLTQLFLKRLIIIVLITLTVMTALAWTAQTHQSEENTDILLNNVIAHVFSSIDLIEKFNNQYELNISHENISEYYGESLPIVKKGGLIIVENGTIIGDTVISDHLNEPISVLNITEKDISGDSGHFHLRLNGTTYQCYYETRGGITVISLLPNSVAFALRNTSVAYLFIGYLLLFAAVYTGIYLLLRRFVLTGIQNLNASMDKITNGDLNEKAAVYDNYEFSQLTDGINRMVNALKDAIAREAARLDSELKYAREIQKASLPKLSALPEDSRFQLSASMVPAREVGGDFYDFFMIDDNTLCAEVADVSGKGIPAALYMMSVKDKIRSAILGNKDHERAFFTVNNDLCASGSNMFVTAFVSVLDLNSGKVTAVNAGHNPPLIYDGVSFEYISCKPNFVLAGMEQCTYQPCDYSLKDGGLFFMYTDGVTECMNKDGGFFGETRLKECLNNAEKEPEKIIEAVQNALNEFSDGADLSDDVTMICFRYFSKNGRLE